MNAPEHFEVLKDYACYRLRGQGALTEAIDKVVEAIGFAREQGMRHLLVDATGWTGVATPGTFDRHRVGEALAEAAGPKVITAVVVRAERVDPDKFGMVVARNRGMLGDVFDSEEEAVEWLLDLKK